SAGRSTFAVWAFSSPLQHPFEQYSPHAQSRHCGVRVLQRPPTRALWALFRRGGENPPAPMNFRRRLKHLSEGFALSAPSVVSVQTFLRFPRLKKEKCLAVGQRLHQIDKFAPLKLCGRRKVLDHESLEVLDFRGFHRYFDDVVQKIGAIWTLCHRSPPGYETCVF